jgi:3-deoxy-D-manno-octulosonate 8-phosphate phosphatase (KDO 8-P phosphatase)
MINISEAKLQFHLSQVKLLALDVDGVMTDGGLYYTESGEELKKFNVKDGMGVKLLMRSGIEVAIISANSSSATIHRAKKLGIKHCFVGIENKLTVLKDLCNFLCISLEQVAYVGDDVTDIPILQSIGCPITVVDAISDNIKYAAYVTKMPGGKGAIREVCELIIQAAHPQTKKTN